MTCAGFVLPLAQAYARHADIQVSPGELQAELVSQLALLPGWLRAAAAAGALFVRWLAPALLLRVLKRFEDLDAQKREALLERLQNAESMLVRGPFLAVKSLLLAVCYGPAGLRLGRRRP